MKINRWSPYQFRNGKTTSNRVVVPPMASQTADSNGYVTEATVKHYENLGRSGAGLVFVEYSFVTTHGKGEANQLGVDHDDQIPGLSLVASAIHSQGALAGLQLVHAGSKTSMDVTGASLQAPSAIPVPVKGWQPELPVEMSLDQITKWISYFTQSALRAQYAGFDFVEIHAAHGYGLNQWLSPLTNKRSDIYGGDIHGRSKILIEIVRSIKALVPELLVAVRLPAQDHFEVGLSTQEMSWVTKELQQNGVDLIDVSSGIGGWKRPEGRSGEGYLVQDASELKKGVTPA